MPLELNREYPEAGEEAIFAEMADVTIRLMEASNQPPLRGQHAKATGCAAATFVVDPAIAEELRHGVFAEPGRSFEAIVRFSNAPGTLAPDSQGTARGLAIKLLQAGGPRAIDGDPDDTQDFLLVNHPVFPFPTPAVYLATMRQRANPPATNPAATTPQSPAALAVAAIVREIQQKQVANPLEETYWSNSPFWLGKADGVAGHTVKYIVVPRQVALERPSDPGKLPRPCRQ